MNCDECEDIFKNTAEDPCVKCATICPICKYPLGPILGDGLRWCYHCMWWTPADGSMMEETREFLKE